MFKTEEGEVSALFSISSCSALAINCVGNPFAKGGSVF